jgi:4-alpha-glucanotransferase
LTDARRWGVQAEYHDAAGRRVEAPAETVAAALAALRSAADEPEVGGALILHPGDALDHPLDVVTEDGRALHIESSVGEEVPLGYHRCAAPAGERPLIVSPRRCHLPAGLREGGWAVQLYATRSEQSWGIGDLADLRSMGRWAGAEGAGFALVSPINAAAMAPPVEPSPYLPTSRRWRNPLYLRVEEVPGCAEALGAGLDAVSAAGRALNADRHIDRDAIAILKLDALARIAAARPPGADFQAWRSSQGDDLERFATFCAIAEDHGGDFREWPAELRDAEAPGVTAAQHRASARVQFHAWLQWLLEQQLADAAAALPLMTDLPIGVNAGGADVWADRDLFARDFTVGAPPDLFNTLGQDWAQPPWHPQQLRARAYAPLIAVLRAGFTHAMGLRIDHVMGLFRLFWIPHGASPRDGVFIRYPAADMLDIVALESVRAAAAVVGEDLGTVEPVVRAEMAARDILSYRLLWFEQSEPGDFPRCALSAATTHDLPTVAGVWTGADAEIRRSIGMPVNDAGDAAMRERLALVAGDSVRDVADVIAAVYSALGASPSMLVAAALEDAAQVVEPPNIPGTTSAVWPNWSLALPQPLGEVLAAPLAGRVAGALRRG